ncbi:MAG: SBBP repeat-containing protein [Planctomycetota bacterium]
MRRLTLLFLILFVCLSQAGRLAAQVTEEWVLRYDGPGNAGDYARAMTVDDAGNVYVTGYSYGTDSHYDYVTAKYDSSGNQLWLAMYNGPGNYYDDARAIAVDVLGNVYVTGYSYGQGTGSDYATIKYNPDGVEQWVARHNGLANANDVAYTLGVDSRGNVYVTGESDNNGSRLDYATIKYNPDGIEQWMATYDGPGNHQDSARAMKLDALDNVYVTGCSYGDGSTMEDYATIKYDSNGVERWVARYAGPASHPSSAYDIAQAIAVDTLGNVYVTGYSDGAGTSYDYATVKYNTHGVEQWVARYTGTGNKYDYAQAIALDKQGNAYVTGYSFNTGTNHDFATVKYDSAGRELWVATYNGPGNNNDRAQDIAVDDAGNAYVTGYSFIGSNLYDYATIKYDPAGNSLWTAIYNGPGNDCDYAYAIALDKLGNVYVAGGSVGDGSRYDLATIKYSQENTRKGSKVEVLTSNVGATITFDRVVGGGSTTGILTQHGPLGPAGLKLVPAGMAYDMNTTAVITGPIQIAIRYDDSELTWAQKNTIVLWRYEAPTNEWVDITTGIDADDNIIYGETYDLTFLAITVTP